VFFAHFAGAVSFLNARENKKKQKKTKSHFGGEKKNTSSQKT
jgi:hypothetical protein